jgi:hypothetical protein
MFEVQSAKILNIKFYLLCATKNSEQCYFLFMHFLTIVFYCRPNLHGTELVPMLSNILNNCMGDDGAVASSLALQAIDSLCHARIVDVATTWKALAPRLSRDTRVPVIKR